MGRPTAYKEEYEQQVYKLCLLGLTDKQIADLWGITERTFNNWKKKPEFFQSIKRGKEIADSDVAAALYKKACGFTHTKTRNSVSQVDEEGNPKQIESKQYFPPDTAAAFIWLKNRQPAIWSDKQDPYDDDAPIPESIKVTIVDGRKPSTK